MNRTILADNERSSRACLLCAERADALVGADLADRTIQRYTVVVGEPEGALHRRRAGAEHRADGRALHRARREVLGRRTTIGG